MIVRLGREVAIFVGFLRNDDDLLRACNRTQSATGGYATISCETVSRYMPQRDPGVYLEDIEHYAAAATRFADGYSQAQYLADEKTRAAVERALEICGEALRQLHRVAPEIADQIPYARNYRLSQYLGAWVRRT